MKEVTAMIIVCLWLTTGLLFAEPTMEALRWSQGEFEILAEIRQITDANGLRPFLYDSNTLLRISAIRRLGEIEGPNAISTLVEVFEKEPPKRGIDRVVIVRNEIVRTLGRMESDKAKTALLDILEKFWKAGPQVSGADKQYWYYDVDFASLVPNTLKQLYKWSGDERTYETAKMIALSKDAKKYDSTISKASWKICLKGDTVKKHLSEKDSAKYLINLIADLEEQGVHRLNSLEAAKRNAARFIVGQHTKTEVLSSIQKEIEEEYATIPCDPNGYFSKRHNRLRNQISYIEMVLRKKADNEKQKKSEKNKTKSDQR